MLSDKSWTALGTSVRVLTNDPLPNPPHKGEGGEPAGAEKGQAADDVVREILDEVDATYSRFRTGSELSRLNRNAGRPVRVSALLGQAIEAALSAARITDGAVDPTIGKAIRLAGYDDDFARLAGDRGPINLKAIAVPGWQAAAFNALTRTVLLPPGVELDLGSTGKALAADLAANAALAAIRDGGVLVSLGGDIATAGKAPKGGWRILVAEDSNVPPESDGQVVCIQEGAIATSSTTVRQWRRGGQVLHHIIDPSTSRPSRGPWRTVTVLGRTCVDANTAATAGIVKGEKAIDWLVAHRYPARLVEQDGTVHFVGPWPDAKEVGHE